MLALWFYSDRAQKRHMRKFSCLALLPHCVATSQYTFEQNFLFTYLNYPDLSKYMSYIPVQSVGQHIPQSGN